MALSAGARLGPYEIVAAAGSGGMGEVYRARDTRLGREVAIKVLPQHLSADAGRRSPEHRMRRIDITPSGDGLVIGAPRPVFGDKPTPAAGDWSIHPDGRRILALVPQTADAEEPLVLVTDWASALEAH